MPFKQLSYNNDYIIYKRDVESSVSCPLLVVLYIFVKLSLFTDNNSNNHPKY